MFTAPAPAAPTVSATPISPVSVAVAVSPSPRSTGLQRGISFLRNYTHGLHLHAADAADGPREDARTPRSRPRASTHASPLSPLAAPSPSLLAAPSPSPLAAPSPSLLAAPSPSPLAAPSPSHTAAPRPSPPARRQTAPLDSADPRQTAPPTASAPASPTPNMTRTRAETAAPQLTMRNSAGPTPTWPADHDNSSASASASASDNAADGGPSQRHLPSIRFIPHQDPRASRPSLQFPTITRTLPDDSAVVRVGRYSERDNLPDTPANAPSAAAIGFKSKVVSRKHCELWCKDGSWYIKDVKSSSGTFLNHIRLSQPNVESKPFRIKDGDIVQLGIDFRGGEEMIFRCVKIRVECNRGWQQGLNTFNKQTHQRLRNLTKTKKEGDSASTHTSECAICLMSIAPCQSLFVAPCSHVWHYKCIRPILNGPTWPNFLCPNCRAVADLEADVDDPAELEDWDDDDAQENGDAAPDAENPAEDRHVTPRASAVPLNGSAAEPGATDLADLQHAITSIHINDTANPQTPFRRLEPLSASVTQPVSIDRGPGSFNGLSPLYLTAHDGLAPDRAHDGPMTPRNDAGPFVLDGSAGRAAGSRLRDESPGSGETDAPSLPPVRFN
ncbi:uncharacterized protein EKO05_0005551 [Ascochyta rabiei]|uniref:uncharacterized protein n=1 Tax=Didymella rabiei TaxID=5454 RepID=UPI0019018D81|nr:uncharacterized protein EKO05_0005551 [Ascochyta rabiei]UPX15088.1 hypothetical protein EKO05_0005551 [Ascochyta rabiei]